MEGLEFLVERTGRINSAQFMIDLKGITDRAALARRTQMNWEACSLPFDEAHFRGLKQSTIEDFR